jgi:cytosine/adenosine deaminase-related metal-dependent hydrolase
MPSLTSEALESFDIRSPRKSPSQYLREVATGSPGTIVHANYLGEDDVDAIAAAGHSVVYCPRAHAFFGHERHPWLRLHGGGIRVAIGTDSSASNDGLSMLDELRHAWRQAGGRESLSPTELWRMGTSTAAAALGYRYLGTLAAGHHADLIAYRVSGAVGDPLQWLLERDEQDLLGVWVGGAEVGSRWRMSNGE